MSCSVCATRVCSNKCFESKKCHGSDRKVSTVNWPFPEWTRGIFSISKSQALENAWSQIYQPLRSQVLLNGLIRVEFKWRLMQVIKDSNFVETPVLKARVYLQEDANWSLASMPKIILNRLEKAVRRIPQFSDILPAIGYFKILYEVQSHGKLDFDVRMSSFYSSLVHLKKQPQELKGFMSIALGTVLSGELERGTLAPYMKFGLEASGYLRGKDMRGLVDYYRTNLGLEVVSPETLESDIEEVDVPMQASVIDVVQACMRNK